MEMGYLGGVCRRPGETVPQPETESWDWPAGLEHFFLHARGPTRLFTWGALALLVRGHVRLAGTSGPPAPDAIAEEVRSHYLDHGDLPADGLEGGFTLALLDGQASRIILFRNLVGSGFTYYHESAGGLLFGDNLARLVNASGSAAEANRDALPAFFLFRFVPGRETLFHGFYRLLPGEQVTWDVHGVRRVQRQTLGRMVGKEPIGPDALDRLGEVTSQILTDCAAHQPDAANLLSGGIDSSFLQVAWNRVNAVEERLPLTFSICVDHPRTWPDTDYAITAARALGTRHTLVPADGPYSAYLLDAVATTGEPPNHVQSAYFGHLARTMKARGVPAGLCGEGADSLFGLGLASQLHNAGLLQALVPGQWTRRTAARLAALLRWSRLSAAFRLAADFHDMADLEHPVNRVAAFTHTPAVDACFGRAAVEDAAFYRRDLLDVYEVEHEPMQRLHAAGFLGEAMDSASLWATLFNAAGLELLCPFLDSRMVRLAMNLTPNVRFRFRRPKDLLKRSLARSVPPSLVRRPKLGFGQPIFEWLAPGGQLRLLAESAGRHDFVDRVAFAEALSRPNWFLYSLVCYDVWHRLFIERSLPAREPLARETTLATGLLR
jgi:asparagine synthase (glutamine-hydrolysing)